MKNLRRWTFVVFAVCALCFPAMAQKVSRSKKSTQLPKKASKQQPKKASSPQSTKATTTLEQIVTPFALPIDGPDKEVGWKSADEAVGVRWRDKVPRNDPTNDGVIRYIRGGTINLLGRGIADVFFKGSQTTVSGIEIYISSWIGKTFEPDQFSEVLHAQFGTKTSIRLLNKCSKDRFAVYEVLLDAKKPIYVKMGDDWGGNDGTDTAYFEFSQRNEEDWKCYTPD